jgi:hypothetical protein
MIESLAEAVRKSDRLVDASAWVIAVLKQFRSMYPGEAIVFVSGILTSDGEEKFWENMAKLRTYTEIVRERYFPLAFSAADIFPQETLERFVAGGANNDTFLKFWDTVLRHSPITDVVFAPGHERSTGSGHEKTLAMERSLGMHILDEDYHLTRI